MNKPENLEFAILTKKYGETIAVDSINLKIPAGTYCCFLGPSGCGKTSTLRMIEGHVEISGGKVACFIFVINLFDLSGSDNLLKKGYQVENLIEFPGH